MLKSDLHIHTSEDGEDSLITYTSKDLIRHYAKLKFEVVSITNHNSIFYNKEIKDYAKRKGILLIKGCEATIEGRHVLVFDSDKIPESFEELEDLRKENAYIMAPHPFFPDPSVLHHKLLEHIKLFDGIEYSFMYLRFINFNRKAVKVAKQHNKPIIGTSDLHHLYDSNFTYGMVDSKKNKDDFLEALRHRSKVELVTRPLPLVKVMRRMAGHVLGV